MHKFSRRTVIAAIEVLEARMSQAEFSRFLLKLGPHFPRWISGENVSLAKRINSLINLYDQTPDRKLDDGSYFASAVVERAVELEIRPNPRPWAENVTPSTFAQLLQVDGFQVSGKALKPQTPSFSGSTSGDDEVSELLKKFGFNVTLGHLQQALDAHARGNWASANAQIRTFMESLFDEIAIEIGACTEDVQSGHQRRIAIAKVKPEFFNTSANEWDGEGKGFLNGVIRRLHSQGSHPGLSDTEDSTFRLRQALLVAHDLLKRLDAR